jgi:hypothetical protein
VASISGISLGGHLYLGPRHVSAGARSASLGPPFGRIYLAASSGGITRSSAQHLISLASARGVPLILFSLSLPSIHFVLPRFHLGRYLGAAVIRLGHSRDLGSGHISPARSHLALGAAAIPPPGWRSPRHLSPGIRGRAANVSSANGKKAICKKKKRKKKTLRKLQHGKKENQQRSKKKATKKKKQKTKKKHKKEKNLQKRHNTKKKTKTNGGGNVQTTGGAPTDTKNAQKREPRRIPRKNHDAKTPATRRPRLPVALFSLRFVFCPQAACEEIQGFWKNRAY